MRKRIVALIMFLTCLCLPGVLLAQHDHGGAQGETGEASPRADPKRDQMEQIHGLVARLAVLNEQLRASEDPAEVREGLAEQAQLLSELRTLVTEHHALMAEQQVEPQVAKSKKKGCGSHRH